MVTLGGSNTVTVSAVAGDVFRQARRPDDPRATLANQGVLLEYQADIWQSSPTTWPCRRLDSRYLELSGGTMSGAIAMGRTRSPGSTNGSGAQDAAAFGQIPTQRGTIGGLVAANNLSDLASVSTARANLDIAVTVPSFPQTYTGGTTIADVLPGPVIGANTITAAGQTWQFQLWGTLTTTADTQTFRVQVLYGGTSGTSLADSSTVNPDSGATITGVPFRLTGMAQFLSATAATASMQVDGNFYILEVAQGAATVDSTTSKQLVIGYTPSASAVSLTVNGGFWQRIS